MPEEGLGEEKKEERGLKKLIAMILALVMMGSLALAEDTAAAQDMMGRKFQFFLERTLQNIVSLQGGDAVLEFKDGDAEMLNVRLQQKEDTVSLKIRQQSGEEILIQATGEGLWMRMNGQAAGIRFEELASMFQSAPMTMPQADSRIYEVVFRLLAQETILKGIKTEQEGGTTRITVDLKVTDMLKGLVQWMDDVLQIPQCKEAIVPLFDQILTAGGSPTGLEAQWPTIREDLLAVETDARLAGEITSAQGGTQVDGKLTLTEGETEYGLAFNTQRDRENSGFQVTLSGNGGYGPSTDVLALRVTASAWTGSFRAELEQIQEGSTLVLNGVSANGTLQLDLSGYPQEKIPYSAHLYFRNGGSMREGYELRLNAANQQSRQDVSLSLNLREGYQSFYLRTNQGWGSSQEISALAQEDRTGKLTYASLTAPGFSAVYEPGKMIYQDGYNKVTVTGEYESELVNVLNVVTENGYSGEPVRRKIRTEITPAGEEKESVSCSVLDENGAALASLRLFADEQEELPLISEMNPMMITKDMLQQLMR